MKNRTAVAYLLLLSMMPFFFVKAFHVHKERACIHDGQQFPHHDSADKCAICLFTLSLFTEAESLEYTHTLTVKPVKYFGGAGRHCYNSPFVSSRSSCPNVIILYGLHALCDDM